MTLILGVPSKGRLEENARAFFARAGMPLIRGRGQRDYRGLIDGVADAEVAFLSAAEIARELALGSVHIGVTGQDLVHETVASTEEMVEVVAQLGFGQANVVVAVPRAWIDVETMADLDDVAHAFRARHGSRLRVATKYLNLTRRFFASHGLADYRIVESLGATEGAPAAGAAEIIVDITTTGATLAANDLKVVEDGVILKSEAALVASLKAPWTGSAKQALAQVLDLVAAEEHARKIHEIRAEWTDGIPAETADWLRRDPELRLVRLDDGGATVHAPRADLYRAVGRLREMGAARVTAVPPDYVFETENPLLDRLLARLSG